MLFKISKCRISHPIMQLRLTLSQKGHGILHSDKNNGDVLLPLCFGKRHSHPQTPVFPPHLCRQQSEPVTSGARISEFPEKYESGTDQKPVFPLPVGKILQSTTVLYSESRFPAYSTKHSY